MLTDVTFLVCFHYVWFKCPRVKLFSFVHNSSECSYQTHGNVRNQASPLMTAAYSRTTTAVSTCVWSYWSLHYQGWKGHSEKGTWLFSCEATQGKFHLTTGSAEVFSGDKEKVFCHPVRGSEKSGRKSRKDVISQLSTPAWFFSVSREGFHTWGNKRAEAEDEI